MNDSPKREVLLLRSRFAILPAHFVNSASTVSQLWVVAEGSWSVTWFYSAIFVYRSSIL